MTSAASQNFLNDNSNFLAAASPGTEKKPNYYAQPYPLYHSETAAADIAHSTLDLLDPAYHEMVTTFGTLDISDETLAAVRQIMNADGSFSEMPDVVETFAVPDSSASFRLFRPEQSEKSAKPVGIYIHGGGMISGRAASSDAHCFQLVQSQDVIVANVEYRLAPETPLPDSVEDCHDVLAYVFNNAEALGVDPNRISVMGHSAGGGLAAALSILTRDRGEVPIKSQFLIYPMLDHRTDTTAGPVNNLATGEFIWNRTNNRYGWNTLRGNYKLDDERIGQFSPSLAPSTAGLPSAFIATGSLDLFREEDADYALRLIRERISCEFHIYDGAVQGFEPIVTAAPSIAFLADLDAAYQRLL